MKVETFFFFSPHRLFLPATDNGRDGSDYYRAARRKHETPTRIALLLLPGSLLPNQTVSNWLINSNRPRNEERDNITLILKPRRFPSQPASTRI